MKSRYLLGFIKTFPAIPPHYYTFFNIYIRHPYIPKAPAVSLTFADKK